MLADFYIARLSNDMKIAEQKNNLWDQIWYRSLDSVKKRRQNNIYFTDGIKKNFLRSCPKTTARKRIFSLFKK